MYHPSLEQTCVTAWFPCVQAVTSPVPSAGAASVDMSAELTGGQDDQHLHRPHDDYVQEVAV